MDSLVSFAARWHRLTTVSSKHVSTAATEPTALKGRQVNNPRDLNNCQAAEDATQVHYCFRLQGLVDPLTWSFPYSELVG